METIQEFKLAIILVDSLKCLYLQKYSYFAPTLSTSNITGKRSRYPMSANKNLKNNKEFLCTLECAQNPSKRLQEKKYKSLKKYRK